MQPPARFAALARVLALTLPAAAVLAQKSTEPTPPSLLQTVWDWLGQSDTELGRGSGPGTVALGQAIGALDPSQARDLVEPALAARIETQLAAVPEAKRGPLVGFLRAHERLAAEMARAVRPADDATNAYDLLARLIETHGERTDELAPLAAAICIVHDQPHDRRVNENTVPPIDPVDLFGYYAANEPAMLVSPRDTPAKILVYLADAHGSLDQYEWARKRYARDRNVGNRYQEITYDTRAFQQDGADTRVTDAGGYSLQTIRQLGGVCADQAYYAMSVGKACGIPSCVAVGRGGEVSHAWVGFIERSGPTSLRWNFSAGRYREYEDVEGRVLDPGLNRRIPDAYLALEATSAAIRPDDRHTSAALMDGALFMAPVGRTEPSADHRIITRQLAMLEAALRLDPGNLDAWLMARGLVATPGSTLEQKEFWTRTVDQLAAQSYPDFAYAFVEPIFDAETDLRVKFNLWDWAAKRFADRPDLAARARLAQTRVMIAQDRKPEAVAAARAVFDRHQAVDGLALAETLLDELGRHAEVLDMYDQAFRRIRQPGRMQAAFLEQTAWHQVGTHYAELLDAAGRGRDAERVRKRLGS